MRENALSSLQARYVFPLVLTVPLGLSASSVGEKGCVDCLCVSQWVPHIADSVHRVDICCSRFAFPLGCDTSFLKHVGHAGLRRPSTPALRSWSARSRLPLTLPRSLGTLLESAFLSCLAATIVCSWRPALVILVRLLELLESRGSLVSVQVLSFRTVVVWTPVAPHPWPHVISNQ